MSFSTVPVAVPRLWKQSGGAPRARDLPADPLGVGGRKDLVWEGGKATREPVLVTSLSERAHKPRRTRGGREEDRPQGEATQEDEAAKGPVGMLGAGGVRSAAAQV